MGTPIGRSEHASLTGRDSTQCQFIASTIPYSCSCGRAFAQPAALKNHQNSCKTAKLCITDALRKAKEVFEVEKLAKAATCPLASGSQPSDLGALNPKQASDVWFQLSSLLQPHLSSRMRLAPQPRLVGVFTRLQQVLPVVILSPWRADLRSAAECSRLTSEMQT